MAWTNAKAAIVAGAVLVIGVGTTLLMTRSTGTETQLLADGCYGHIISPRDIWNHVVNTPIQVSSNGIALTNWGASYIRVEDASGNWDYNLASHRSLDD